MNFILGVNIDHIATLRNARNEGHPDLITMALLAQESGSHQIVAHLREDRRHIKDKDLYDLKTHLKIPLNMEMAITDEMLEIALKVKPYTVCLVPEKRQELTTEGGLDVVKHYNTLENKIRQLQQANIKVSLFIDANLEQIQACTNLKVNAVEINTGVYCNLTEENKTFEINKIKEISAYGVANNLKIHAGHGLTTANIGEIAVIKDIIEFNIGYFIISRALSIGLKAAIQEILQAIQIQRQIYDLK
ncbi:Pyridoxine 5'-phosphate synthase [Candidatus Hepatincolaceae symbiont of Richtersius coronifer]